MYFAQKIDFNALMEPVALRLLGEPTQKHANEWRYGSRGSLVIDIVNGRWFDHEANKGGGVFDLIRRQGYDQPAAWLRSEGLLGSPQVASRTGPRFVKAYDYCDETGKLLYQVLRYDPKSFSQRRPDGRVGWIPNLQNTRRVLYRLPELVEAVAAGETIYIPEGEKTPTTFALSALRRRPIPAAPRNGATNIHSTCAVRMLWCFPTITPRVANMASM